MSFKRSNNAILNTDNVGYELAKKRLEESRRKRRMENTTQEDDLKKELAEVKRMMYALQEELNRLISNPNIQQLLSKG